MAVVKPQQSLDYLFVYSLLSTFIPRVYVQYVLIVNYEQSAGPYCPHHSPCERPGEGVVWRKKV